jgi:hypothetical protein
VSYTKKVTVANHKPVKSLPTAADYRKERRERYLAESKERRQARFEEAREEVRQHPHRGDEYYYVIHGHGGILHSLIGKTFALVNVNAIFYCNDGQTTNQSAALSVNVRWPQLLNRLRIGNTVPSEYIAETITAGHNCQALMLFPGHDIHDIPDAGVYFVCRQPGFQPYINTKLCGLTAMTTFLKLINTVILPDSITRGLDTPIDIHWIACRFHMPQ